MNSESISAEMKGVPSDNIEASEQEQAERKRSAEIAREKLERKLFFVRHPSESPVFRQLERVVLPPEDTNSSLSGLSTNGSGNEFLFKAKRVAFRNYETKLNQNAAYIAAVADSTQYLEADIQLPEDDLIHGVKTKLETAVLEQDRVLRQKVQAEVTPVVDALMDYGDLSVLSDTELAQLCDDRLANNEKFMNELERRILLSETFVIDALPGAFADDRYKTGLEQRYPAIYHQLTQDGQGRQEDYLQIWQMKYDHLTKNLDERYKKSPLMQRGLGTLGVLDRQGLLGEKSKELLAQISEKKYASIVDFDYRLFNEQIINDFDTDFVQKLLIHRELSNQLLYLHERQSALYQLFRRYYHKLQEDVSLGDFNERCELGLRFIFNNQVALQKYDLESIQPGALLDYIVYGNERPEKMVELTNDFQDKLIAQASKQMSELVKDLLDVKGLSIQQVDALLNQQDENEVKMQVRASIEAAKQAFLGSSRRILQDFADQYGFFEEQLRDNAPVTPDMSEEIAGRLQVSWGDRQTRVEKMIQAYKLGERDAQNIKTMADFINFIDQSRFDFMNFVEFTSMISNKLPLRPCETFHLEKTLADYCRSDLEQRLEMSVQALKDVQIETIDYEREVGTKKLQLQVINVSKEENFDLLENLDVLVYNNNTGWKSKPAHGMRQPGVNGAEVDFSQVNYAENWLQIDPYAHQTLSTAYLDGRTPYAQKTVKTSEGEEQKEIVRNFAHVPAEKIGAVLYGIFGAEIVGMSPGNIDVDSSHYSVVRQHKSVFRSNEEFPKRKYSNEPPDYYNEVLIQRAGVMPKCLLVFESEFLTGEDRDADAAKRKEINERNLAAAKKAAADWQEMGVDLPIIYIKKDLFDGESIRRES